MIIRNINLSMVLAVAVAASACTTLSGFQANAGKLRCDTIIIPHFKPPTQRVCVRVADARPQHQSDTNTHVRR